MQATRTSWRGAGRIDEGAFKASVQGLVFARLGHNLLRDAVVRVCDKSILPSRDTPQHTPGRATAVGLQTSSCLLQLSFLVAHKLRRLESIVMAMQFPFAGHLRDRVAGFGELAD